MSEMNETDWKLAYAICKAESDDTPCACEQEEEFPCRVYSKGAEIACRLVTAELAATPMADEDALVEAMGQAIQDEMRPSDGWIESEAARFAKDMSRAALSAIRSHLAALQARAEAAEKERDELRAAIFGSQKYDPCLKHGNFLEMAASTERGRLGAIARAEAAEAENARLRDMLIADTIGACTECNEHGQFKKQPNCEGCIAAVDDRIAAALGDKL